MFDRCRVWRDLLTRRAEGALTPMERALLEEHVAHCPACRNAQAADQALETLWAPAGEAMNTQAARAFDDRVIHILQTAPGPMPAGPFWQRLRTFPPDFSFDFCIQWAGGALVAASITAVCLLSALHPGAASRPNTASDTNTVAARERNEPPVPLESLFQAPSPRAALLWTTPAGLHQRSLPAPSLHDPDARPGAGLPKQKRLPVDPRPHSERTPPVIMG